MMRSERKRRMRWPTIWLWLLTAGVAGVVAMNWHESASRQYSVSDDLPQLLRSTISVDLSGRFHCGNQPMPAGLQFGYDGMHSIDNVMLQPRLCKVTTVCIWPAPWNLRPDSGERHNTLAWLAELKTLTKIRFSYPAVTADDLAPLSTLPALTTMKLDYVPRTDEVWTAVGQLAWLEELGIGKPAAAEPNRRAASDWADDDPLQTRGDAEGDEQLDWPSVDETKVDAQPARFGQRQLNLMGGLPLLRRLTLARLTIEDDVLSRLASLEMLKLSHCELPHEAYIALAGCGHVTQLDIEEMSPGASGAACVAAMPRLRTLKFDGPLTDDELQALCASRTLNSLELTDVSRLSPKTLALLAEVPIERLKIHFGPRDPAEPCLVALQRVATLRDLTLDVGELDFPHVRGLSHLKKLNQLTIEGARVTSQQISELDRAMPRATFYLRSTHSPELLELRPGNNMSQFDSAADAQDKPEE